MARKSLKISLHPFFRIFHFYEDFILCIGFFLRLFNVRKSLWITLHSLFRTFYFYWNHIVLYFFSNSNLVRKYTFMIHNDANHISKMFYFYWNHIVSEFISHNSILIFHFHFHFHFHISLHPCSSQENLFLSKSYCIGFSLPLLYFGEKVPSKTSTDFKISRIFYFYYLI